jgi:hypothetical protein
MRKEGSYMIQWIGVIITLCGLVYSGIRDVQNGTFKIPQVSKTEVLTKTNYPIQYCLMAYDPNTDKVYYQHENGIWYDYAPQQRRYASTPQRGQDQEGYAVGNAAGTPRTQVYGVR